MEGVVGAVSGYTGGSRDTARYERIGRGDTGHAEAVQVRYDPAKVGFEDLLQIFFSVAHDPTQLDRQGPDWGPQYRSAVFPLDARQRRIASNYVAQLDRARLFEQPLATRIESFDTFYPAEAYHQDFLSMNPRHAYIVAHDMPKLAELERVFPERYRDRPVLVGDTAGQGRQAS